MRTELFEAFLVEGRELVDDASDGLLELERAPHDAEHLKRVFRSVHTLKGSSGLFEVGPLSDLLHAAEELLVAVREARFDLDSSLVDALLASADLVKHILDELDRDEALSEGSKADAIRLAGQLAARMNGTEVEEGAEAEQAPAAPQALREWVLALPRELLAPTADGPVTAFEYQPEPSCFFRGEDPVATVSSVPGLRHRILETEPTDAEDLFSCHLVLRGISTASLEDVRYALRYVEEESWVASVSPALAATEEPTRDPPSTGRCTLAEDLAAKQLEVLDAWPEDEAPHVAETLRRCFLASQSTDALARLERLERPVTQELHMLLEGLKAPPQEPTPPVVETSTKDTSPVAKVLRVEQAKIERLLNLIGQLVVAKNGLPYLVRRLEQREDPKTLGRDLKEGAAVIDRISRELQSAIMEVRMLPVSQVFQRFPRLVRDVSRKLGKDIELILEGEDTRADKNIIEALSDPLIHLVRNSLDHGIEPPSERAAKGKPVRGQIKLLAKNENESVLISVEDDGRGIDPVLIRQSAVRKGIITEEAAAKLSDQEARMLIFAAGFSTKQETSELSGRGVGMDVVRSSIEKVGGKILVEGQVGSGTSIRLLLPLSMAVSRVMTAVIDGQLYGIGMDTVVETVRFPLDQVQRIKDREAFVLRGELLPLMRGRTALGLRPKDVLNNYGELAILVLRIDRETVGLVVDQLGENIEVLTRPLDGVLSDLGEIAGTAVLGDGRLLLILDTKEMFRNDRRDQR